MTETSGSDTGIAADRLRSLVERIERLDEEPPRAWDVMDTLTFIADLFKAAVWPLALVACWFITTRQARLRDRQKSFQCEGHQPKPGPKPPPPSGGSSAGRAAPGANSA